MSDTPVHDRLVRDRAAAVLRDEAEACIADYRVLWPQPHALAPNLQLLVRACDLLGVPVSEARR